MQKTNEKHQKNEGAPFPKIDVGMYFNTKPWEKF